MAQQKKTIQLCGNLGRILFACVPLVLAQRSTAAETPERTYQAQWIWCKPEHPAPFQFARFTRTVEVSALPERATAFVAADTFYRLWINGRLAMHGPARSSRGKATVDPIDVRPFLAQGKNTLMIEVFHGVCPFEALAQAPGLLCEVEAESGGNRTLLTATDASWQAAEITAWSRESLKFNFQRGWLEQVDARETLTEKTLPATVLGGVGTPPWKTVFLRDVPLPAPLKEIRPVSVMAVQRGDGTHEYFHGPEERIEPKEEWDKRSEWFQRLQTEHLKADPTAATNPDALIAQGQGSTVLNGEAASVAYDLGQGYEGFVGFEVEGKAGEALDVVWGDRLAGDGSLRPSVQTGRNAVRYTLRDGRQRFLSFTPQFARYLRVEHRGTESVTLHRLGFTEFRFPDDPQGDFVCSDDNVNRVYRTARWTAALNTLDTYMDCPHRERNAMYGVEGYWMQKAVYPFFGDTRVSRRCILDGADGINDPDGTGYPADLVHVAYPMHIPFFNAIIPTQPLFWVLHAGVYERCSCDADLIRTLLPAFEKNMAAFYAWRNSDGLLESIPSWMFFDYADIRTDGASVALNSLYAQTLDEMARFERAVGSAPKADEFAAQARRVRESLNRLCPGELYYPDVLIRNEQKQLVPAPQACETTQYFVLWNGVPSADRARRMWQSLRDDFAPTPLKHVQPIQGLSRAGLYPFLQRLEVAGRLGDHAALLRDAQAMFLPMAQQPPNTLWEDPMAQIALCHSIGCGVGGVLTEEILGIRFGYPLLIAPHSGGTLTWCKGHLATPKGRVGVAWHIQKDRYQLQASIPQGATARIALPPEAKAVWQSGSAKKPWSDSVEIAADATLTVSPGDIEQRAGVNPPLPIP